MRIGDASVGSASFASIGSISKTQNSDYAILWLSTSGDLASIQNAERIHNMTVGDDVNGSVTTLRETASDSGSVVNCVVHGSAFGDWSIRGNIEGVVIEGGYGSGVGAPKLMQAFGNIVDLRVGEVRENATILAEGPSGEARAISILEIDDQWGASGDMDGEIIANGLAPIPSGVDSRVKVTGDLNGRIEFFGQMNRKILVGGSFNTGAEIDLPSNGILNQGQITFGASGTGSPVWSGSLEIGGVTYGAGYTALPSSIGGGAAGLAPFTAHDEACFPENGAVMFITELDPLDPELNCYDIVDVYEIEVRLYGPVELIEDEMDPLPLEVSYMSPTDTAFSPIPFGIEIELDTGSSAAGRIIRISRSDSSEFPFGSYKIQPKTGRVQCEDVSGDPDADFLYGFELLDGCELMLLSTYDLNSDDTLCAADIAEWTLNPVDFNNDSAADGDDATLLLGAVNAYNN